MADFNIKSDSVDVERIMHQIRTRIREKRGVDYTEDEIRALANVKLESFLDPTKVRSDLLEQYRKRRSATPPPNYTFDPNSPFASSRGVFGLILRGIRKVLNPVLKLMINPNPIVSALHAQTAINEHYDRVAELNYEILHNLVIEVTRLGIDVKNLKMRVESLSSRLDFDERRARAFEGAVQYRATAPRPASRDQAATASGASPVTTTADPGAAAAIGDAQRRRRRRRRGGRGRRNGAAPGATPTPEDASAASEPPADTQASAAPPEPPAPDRPDEQ